MVSVQKEKHGKKWTERVGQRRLRQTEGARLGRDTAAQAELGVEHFVDQQARGVGWAGEAKWGSGRTRGEGGEQETVGARAGLLSAKGSPVRQRGGCGAAHTTERGGGGGG